MTRKRTGKPLYNYFQERCPMCEGTGKIKSKDAVIHGMMSEIRECVKDEDISTIKVILSKKLKTAFKELYFEFVEDFVKNRRKKLVLEENNLNTYNYEIILVK